MLSKRLFLFFTFLSFSYILYGGGFTVWQEPELTPHSNLLNCDGSYDVSFMYSEDRYESIKDKDDIPYVIYFKEFSFCGDYFVAKDEANHRVSHYNTRKPVYYIINEVNPQVEKFDNIEDFNNALKAKNIKPRKWYNSSYGDSIGDGMMMWLIIYIILAVLVLFVILWTLIYLIRKILFYFLK